MAEQITYRGKRADLEAALRALPAILSGRVSDPTGIVDGLHRAAATTLESLVRSSFLDKARGGPGADNSPWEPLKPATIAQRRTTAAERKAAGVGGKRTRGLLTASQDKRWRHLFGTRLAALMLKGVPPEQAKQIAAKIAWAVLKGEGAKTKLATFGGRQVMVGMDTGNLFRRFSGGYRAPGELFVTNNADYAAHFHARRPMWPTDGKIPDGWAQQLMSGYKRGVARVAAALAAGAA